jgi:hypothetical protein
MWSAVPGRNATFTFRANSFRLLARSGACIEEYFGRRARIFPLPLFLLVENDDAATLASVRAAANECDGLLDDWTRQLLVAYPQLDDDEFNVLLETEALVGHVDNSYLEVLQGKLRKEVVSRVQTHKMSLQDVSALLVMRQEFENDACFRPLRVAATGGLAPKTDSAKVTLAADSVAAWNVYLSTVVNVFVWP